VFDGHALDLQVEIGQDRRAHFGVEAADLFIDALAGTNVGAGAALLLGQGVEQQGVHVIAHAEGEDAQVRGGRLVDVVEDERGFDHAAGGQAIGQKDDGSRSLGVGGGNGLQQRPVDVGAAARRQVV